MPGREIAAIRGEDYHLDAVICQGPSECLVDGKDQFGIERIVLVGAGHDHAGNALGGIFVPDEII